MITAHPPLYPLVFTPIYKDYIWGGERIISRYHRSAGPGIYAESWEISDRPADMSIAANGPLAGRSLHDLVHAYGPELLGSTSPLDRFPLLIKILDARDRLSVQVHPDEAGAKTVGGEAKAEMWYVLDAEPGAQVFAGVKPGVKAAQFRKAIQQGTVTDLLTAVTVVPGDVIYIPGGRAHSIGAGCLLLEAQQNSDTTFRVFDWNRTGYDGQQRQLHIDEAMRVIHWQDNEPAALPAPASLWTAGLTKPAIYERLSTPYFNVKQIVLTTGTLSFSTTERGFHILFVEQGSLKVRGNYAIVSAEAGRTLLIPAAVGAYEVLGQGEQARAIQISLP